jgi:hypothetical protein
MVLVMTTMQASLQITKIQCADLLGVDGRRRVYLVLYNSDWHSTRSI